MTKNFIDVFSGAGGLSCGLEMAGFNCLLGIDKESSFLETFKYNHENADILNCSVENLTKKKLKTILGDRSINLVVGGPPCQGFSTVGRGDPTDKRNSLFLQFISIVQWLRPEYIIIENVTGLLARKNEETLKKIFSLFHQMKYLLDARVLSAHHYGVSQKRRRTIIMGTRINKKLSFPLPTHDTKRNGCYHPPVTIGKVFCGLNKNLPNHDIKKAMLKSTLDQRRLRRIPEGKGIRYERDEKEYLTPSLYMGVDWKTLPEGRFRQTKYQRLDRKKTGYTIMTRNNMYYHPTENRYLTPREAARIQSFPDSFKFFGTHSSQWKQIGNAVPPLLGKALGESIMKMYESRKKNRTNNTDVDNLIEKIRETAFIYKGPPSTKDARN